MFVVQGRVMFQNELRIEVEKGKLSAVNDQSPIQVANL